MPAFFVFAFVFFPPAHGKSPCSRHVCVCARHNVFRRKLAQCNVRISANLKVCLFARKCFATQACVHINNCRVSCMALSEFEAQLIGGSLVFFSHTLENHLFSSCLSACPTPCFKSQLGTIQRSDLNKSEDVPFPTQAGIHTN